MKISTNAPHHTTTVIVNNKEVFCWKYAIIKLCIVTRNLTTRVLIDLLTKKIGLLKGLYNCMHIHTAFVQCILPSFPSLFCFKVYKTICFIIHFRYSLPVHVCSCVLKLPYVCMYVSPPFHVVFIFAPLCSPTYVSPFFIVCCKHALCILVCICV